MRGNTFPEKHLQGEVHAYLVLRDDGGKLLGYADEVNVPAGRVWNSRLTIHFLDGSLMDERTVYAQGSSLRLIQDHLVQKGPSFPQPSDVTIDASKGQITYHENKDGRDETRTDAMEMPADLANGLMPIVLQNSRPGNGAEAKVSYIVTTPRPRLVKIAIHSDGEQGFRLGGATRSAARFRLHVEIGGMEGMLAPLVGKEPPDLNAWVSSGVAPTFLKLHGFLYLGGPQWTLQLTSPQW